MIRKPNYSTDVETLLSKEYVRVLGELVEKSGKKFVYHWREYNTLEDVEKKIMAIHGIISNSIKK